MRHPASTHTGTSANRGQPCALEILKPALTKSSYVAIVGTRVRRAYVTSVAHDMAVWTKACPYCLARRPLHGSRRA